MAVEYKVHHKSRMQQLQDHVLAYREAGNRWPAPRTEIARWAIENNRCQIEPQDYVKILAADIGRAMREDFFTDPQGRRVRLYHPRTVEEFRDGELKQTVLWGDMPNMSTSEMQASLQLRRRGILSDCVQLNNDRESYNDNFNKGEVIQIVLDFSDDVEELKHPESYVDYSYESENDSGDEVL